MAYPFSIKIPENWQQLYDLFTAFYDVSLRNDDRASWLSDRTSGMIPFYQSLNGQALSSSGYTLGTSFSYRWGPSFMVMHEFVSRMFAAKSYQYDDWLKARSATILVKKLSVDDSKTIVDPGVIYQDPVFKAYELINLNANDARGFKRMMGSICSSIENGCLILSPSVVQVIYDFVTLRDCFLSILNDFNVDLILTYESVCPDLWLKLKDSKLPGLRNQMRCWNGGATFYTCSAGNVHWVDMLADVKTEDDGSLSSYDIWNYEQNFYWYHNDDMCQINDYKLCDCGMVRRDGSCPTRKKDEHEAIKELYSFWPVLFSIIVDPLVVKLQSCYVPNSDVLEKVRSLFDVVMVDWIPYVELYRGKLRRLVFSNSCRPVE